MFCPYHGEDHSDGRPFSVEHIVPYSIGGSDAFTIKVCKNSNDQAGSSIDPLLTDNFFIGSERVVRELRGRSGELPKWSFKWTMERDGRPVKVRYSFSSTERKLWTQPLVEWRPVGDKIEIRIEASEDQLPGMLPGINRKLRALGKRELTLEEFRAKIERSEPTRLDGTIRESFDVTAFERPYVKMALGTAHFVLGQPFSRSRDADRLRAALWESDAARREALGLQGVVWPNVEDVDTVVEQLRYKNQHTVWLMSAGVLGFGAVLFGKYFGTLKISDDEAFHDRLPLGGIIFIIEPETRALRRMSIAEFLSLKQSERAS